MLNFLSSAVKAGFGLAAISAAIFWSVHEGFVQASIFAQMTPEQTYNAFIWSIGVAGLALILAIVLSAGNKSVGKTITADNGGYAIDNSGFLNKFKLFDRKGEKK
ncbi:MULTISPECIES: hypothetical protein [unclassified Pseudoalteromonas]|uniref:hypothetical protein n=1 Tax=unclassified Pseudoalteromonas TaxID=194690 RepID=UPI0005A90946|nr:MULTISPECIES: hypothetical protein [unclassified Pseudoalteromonas]